MKVFTNLRKKINSSDRLKFIKTILIFYVIMMGIYGYLMLANLSTAPKFIYSEF